jgi:acid phosphatase
MSNEGIRLLQALLGACLIAALCGCTDVKPHEELHSVLWMRQSAEYHAATVQAYRTATENLKQALADPRAWPSAVDAAPPAADRPLAVIVDIDETVLDNTSAERAHIKADRRAFDVPSWKEWERRAEARAIEGAREFLQFAASQHVALFYVSNRFYKEALRQNLLKLQLPLDADEDRILFQGECAGGDASTDKECRRQDVAARYHVALIIGDDLSDFISVKGLSVSARLRLGQAAASRWGREWIVIPNPAYGSWERAFYDPQHDRGSAILRKKLRALEDLP